jgi:HAD superfamily hydrolase (TIGR01490 family)
MTTDPIAGMHFWDMDHTVINGDCDVSWKEFLIDIGLAPPSIRDDIQMFFDQYNRGELDHDAFILFQLAEFKGRSAAEMADLARQHFERIVKPVIYPEAIDRINALHDAGAPQCLITATSRIIAEPVAAHLGFEHVVGTELEMADGVFTGRITGEYCGGPGKVAWMQRFLAEHGGMLAESAYYGDSSTDIPVMQAVGHPVCTNPSQGLRQAARQNDWEIITFQPPSSDQ